MTGNDILALTALKYKPFKQSGDSQVNLSWINEINSELYESVQRLIPESFIKEQAYTLVSGTYQYTLPTDFGNINLRTLNIPKENIYYFNTSYTNPGYHLKNDNISVLCGLFKFSNGNLENEWDFTGRGSHSIGYWIDESVSKLEITPRDHTQTDALTLRYVPELTEISSLSTGDILLPRAQNKWQQYWVESLKELWARDIDLNPVLQSQFSQEKYRQFIRLMSEIQPKKTRIIKLK